MKNTKEIIKKINADFASIIQNALNKYDVPICSLDNSMHEEINDLYKWAFDELDDNAKVTLQDEYNSYKVILARLDYLVTKFAYENTKFNYLVSGSQFWKLKNEKDKEIPEDGSARWAELLERMSKLENKKSEKENDEDVVAKDSSLYFEQREQMPEDTKENLENDKLKFVDNDGNPMENISKSAFGNFNNEKDEELPDIAIDDQTPKNDIDDLKNINVEKEVASGIPTFKETSKTNDNISEDDLNEAENIEDMNEHSFVVEEKPEEKVKPLEPVQPILQNFEKEVVASPVANSEEITKSVADSVAPSLTKGKDIKNLEISQDDFFVLDELNDEEEKTNFKDDNNEPRFTVNEAVTEQRTAMAQPVQPSPQNIVKENIAEEKIAEPELSIDDIPFFKDRQF